MSNSPGFRGGAIGSAVPKSFSSSPNSGAPFQRTCQTASVDSVLPSNSIDFSFNRNVANPFAAIFGSVITHPTAVTTRGRSPSLRASCWPAVFVVANLCSKKKPVATMRYVAGNFGQQSAIRMQIPRTIARNERGRRQRNNLRQDNSRRSHQRQSDKWLTRRAQQFHSAEVFAYPTLAAQAAMCALMRPRSLARLLASAARRNFSRAGPIRGSAGH